MSDYFFSPPPKTYRGENDLSRGARMRYRFVGGLSLAFFFVLHSLAFGQQAQDAASQPSPASQQVAQSDSPSKRSRRLHRPINTKWVHSTFRSIGARALKDGIGSKAPLETVITAFGIPCCASA